MFLFIFFSVSVILKSDENNRGCDFCHNQAALAVVENFRLISVTLSHLFPENTLPVISGNTEAKAVQQEHKL